MTIQPKQIQAYYGLLPREKLLVFHSSIHHLSKGRYDTKKYIGHSLDSRFVYFNIIMRI